MKKIFSLFVFFAVSASMFAQKSYVTVECALGSGSTAYLSGDIPSSMKSSYNSSDFGGYGNGNTWVGNLLNMLAKEGFSVEQMNMTSNKPFFLLSKSSEGSSNGARMIRVEDNSDVYEVARYNLQGMPINESEKGIQIIVYSNFTTKTIIKE